MTAHAESSSLPAARSKPDVPLGASSSLPARIGIPSASLPGWPTELGIAGHKLVGHAEQVPQYIGIDPRQANQHPLPPT